MKIDVRALEKMLYTIEEIMENIGSQISTSFQKLKRQALEIPETFFQDFLAAARILVRSPGNKVGKLIVLTGIDKSGKETQAFNPDHRPEILSLYQYLVNRSSRVMGLSLPSYKTTFGSLIASYLGKEDAAITIEGNLADDIAWVLWSLDRTQHNQRIEEWLQSNPRSIVLSKRWIETNIAYQKPLGISEKRLLRLERNLVKANYTIVLDVPLELVFKRMEISGESPDKYETPELLSKVSGIYKDLEQFYPIGKTLHVDGSGSFAEVNKRLIEAISNALFSQHSQDVSEKFC